MISPLRFKGIYPIQIQDQRGGLSFLERSDLDHIARTTTAVLKRTQQIPANSVQHEFSRGLIDRLYKALRQGLKHKIIFANTKVANQLTYEDPKLLCLDRDDLSIDWFLFVDDDSGDDATFAQQMIDSGNSQTIMAEALEAGLNIQEDYPISVQIYDWKIPRRAFSRLDITENSTLHLTIGFKQAKYRIKGFPITISQVPKSKPRTIHPHDT